MAAFLKRVSPLGRLVFERSSFSNEKEKHRKCIFDHYFNASVNIVLPGCDATPVAIDNMLTNQESYLARQVPLAMLLDPDFIEGFVKKGDVYMLSHGTCIDSENCVALLPTGTLMMSLTKDTFQMLGLEGRKCAAGKDSGKHMVEVDLTASYFYPGKKSYNRVKWCFTDRLNLKFDFLLAWQPKDEKISPSSVQNYFKCNNIVCNRIQISRTTQQFKDFTVPVINPDIISPEPGTDQSEQSCDYLEVFDWLGACAVGAEMSDRRADDFVSSYTCPVPNQNVRVGVSSTYTGMFTCYTIQKAVDTLRERMTKQNLAWSCITVHGFQDSPVSWQQRYHGYHHCGDNLYTLVMFPGGQYWLYTAIADRDVCP